MTAERQPNQADVVAYWQFICGIPAAQNPMLDATGEKALRAQEEAVKDLVYLSGSNGANRVRNIPDNIPSGRDIFIAVNPVVVTEPEAGTSNTSDLKKYAMEDEDSATTTKLTINGQPHDFNRVGTEPFNVTFPDNGIFCAPKGTFSAVADGYYAIIHGLPSGNYTIDIEAEVANPFKGFREAVPWKDKVTYNIKI